MELEQQSGDETEEEHSQQDCQRRAVNPQRWDEAGEASFDPVEVSDG